MVKLKWDIKKLKEYTKIIYGFKEDIYILVNGNKGNAKSLFLISTLKDGEEYNIDINSTNELIINKFNTAINSLNE